MASKYRDIGLKFRYRSTPNTRRVTKNIGFGFGGGRGSIYIYIYIEFQKVITTSSEEFIWERCFKRLILSVNRRQALIPSHP